MADGSSGKAGEKEARSRAARAPAGGARTRPSGAAVGRTNDERLRVILVGKTGLDAALRSDQSIELIRASTAINAIGELADPIDETTPEASVVIVAEDAEPGAEVEDFIDNLHLVEPAVRVLRVAPQNDAPVDPAYDGSIDPSLEPQELRRLIRALDVPLTTETGAEGHSEQGEPFEPDLPVPTTLPPSPMPGGPKPTPDADSALLDALLTGRDVLLPALEAIRRRGGGPDAVYVPTGGAREDPSRPIVARVLHHQRTLGELRASHADQATLNGLAAWLARWLMLREQQDQLRVAAFTDDLTGAYNRRYFDRFLKTALAQASEQRQSVTVLCFDIDDFKKYNDRYGHTAGDDILRETVRLLKSVIRPTDRVCRIGGDEFAVIFHEPAGPRDPASKPPASIAQIASRFQRQICEHRFPKLAEEAPGTLTISGGLATFPWDGRTAEELLDRADQLACASKRQGKNAITVGPGAQRVCRLEARATEPPAPAGS